MDIKIKEVASLLLKLSRAKQQNQYQGSLKDKIKLTDICKADNLYPFYTSDQQRQHIWEIISQIRVNIPLLFQHYDVNPDHSEAWQTLAIKLAHAHVNGFQPYVQKGRPKVASIKTLCSFYRFYNKYKTGKIDGKPRQDFSQSALCLHLLKHSEFRKQFPEFSNITAKKSLENILSEARALRRERILWAADVYYRKRPSFDETGIFPSYPPPWIYEHPNALSRKYAYDLPIPKRHETPFGDKNT